MPTEVAIRPAAAADLSLATNWLAAEGLPTEDLTASHMDKFIIAVRADQAVGMIGLETFGNSGLLRSLVIDQSSRGGGIGPALVAALERKAQATALQELWLLTIDADGFFAHLGYARKERANAPVAIQTTPEFASLCPGDAVLMCKRLD